MYRGQEAFRYLGAGKERVIPNDDLNLEPCCRCDKSWICHLGSVPTINCKWNSDPSYCRQFSPKRDPNEIDLKEFFL